MKRLKLFFINGVYSALIGVATEIIISLFRKQKAIYFGDLLSSMLSGICIGTISLFFLVNIVIRFKMRLFAAILSNTIIMLAFFLLPIGRKYELSSYVIFIIIEALSVILTILWYKEMSLYNRMLKRKQILSSDLSVDSKLMKTNKEGDSDD